MMENYYEAVSSSGDSQVTMIPNQGLVGSGAYRMPYQLEEEGGIAVPPVPPILPVPRQSTLKWMYAGVATIILISVATLVLVAILLSTRQDATTPTLDSSTTRLESTTSYPGIYSFYGQKI